MSLLMYPTHHVAVPLKRHFLLFCGCNFWSPFHVAIISTPIREKWQLGWRLNCKSYFIFSNKKWSRSDDCRSGSSSRISTNMYSYILGIWSHLVGWYSNLVGKVAARTCGRFRVVPIFSNNGFVSMIVVAVVAVAGVLIICTEYYLRYILVYTR